MTRFGIAVSILFTLGCAGTTEPPPPRAETIREAAWLAAAGSDWSRPPILVVGECVYAPADLAVFRFSRRPAAPQAHGRNLPRRNGIRTCGADRFHPAPRWRDRAASGAVPGGAAELVAYEAEVWALRSDPACPEDAGAAPRP